MPGHGIGMYGICPASAITQVGTAWDAIQINALLLQLRLVTVANVGLQTPILNLLSLLGCVSRVLPVLLVIVARSWCRSYIELQNGRKGPRLTQNQKQVSCGA